jgi:tetratricopeptide (TPR) repeat protein
MRAPKKAHPGLSFFATESDREPAIGAGRRGFASVENASAQKRHALFLERHASGGRISAGSAAATRLFRRKRRTMRKRRPAKISDVRSEIERAVALLDEGEPERALERLERAAPAATKPADLADLHFLRGECYLESGEARRALAAYDEALRQDPGDPAILAARAEALFDLWEFAEAERTAARALEIDPDLAPAHRTLALVFDRRGERRRAERHFERAHALDPETWPLPVRTERREFDRMAREAIESLPPFVKERLGPIGFFVEDYPRLAQLGDRPDEADPQALGVFFGEEIPARYEGRSAAFVPNHIVLFQRNLEQLARDRAELEKEIRTTVYHEVGHYLGFDEEGLDEIGLA